jgi:RNA polymerase sigma factor (sigma-70 family)
MSTGKIAIVDDHRVVIEGIKSALASHPEFEVVGEAINGLEAVEIVKSLKPDIVIMDVSMPELNGIEATRQIKQSDPKTRVVVYTMYSDKEIVIDLFKAGISAYVLKEDPLPELIVALNAVKDGGTYFSSFAPAALISHMEELEERQSQEDPLETLSKREKEVFQLIAEGRKIKEIAHELCISPKTVESHKYHIMEKLQISSMLDLAKIAIKKDMIKI